MLTIEIEPGTEFTNFGQAKELADARADEQLGPSACMSWYNRAEDREAPAHASECHDACEIPGYIEYAQTRGAELKVVVGKDDFVFCYRPLGEFADC